MVHNIYAQKRGGEANETDNRKKKTYVGIAWVNVKSCITEAFLFYGTEVQWTKWLLTLFTK